MSNILRIEGVTTHGVFHKEYGCVIEKSLSAVYQETVFKLISFGGNFVRDPPKAAFFFSREDETRKPGEVNYFILSTKPNGKYEADGIINLECPHKSTPEDYYNFGADLEIIVDKEAEEAIELMMKDGPEIEKQELFNGQEVSFKDCTGPYTNMN
ncbi:MAG: hypothetical protein GY861_10735 [bacterium]|nr:hypothetical protein [bacterium]